VKISIRSGILSALALGVLCANSARADDGSWEVRLRALNAQMTHHSNAIPSLAVPNDAIQVNNKWLPELDVEYFFTPHISTELILTYPQNQRVEVKQSALGGPVTIGTFRHLPPTLTAKYNFLPGQDFQPYVGAGINITYISNVNLAVPTVGRLDLKHWSVGPALQAGFDYRITGSWFANMDVKWAMLGTDVMLGNTRVSAVHLDPMLYSFGVGYRF
jgi:outer membrane protein